MENILFFEPSSRFNPLNDFLFFKVMGEKGEDADPSIILSDALEIHFINMVKYRKQSKKDIKDNPLDRWLAWLDLKSPPELIEEVLNMDSAIMAANEKQEFVTQDEEDRDLYWRRQIAIMDYNRGINNARREAKLEIARNLKRIGIPIEQIAEGTDLDLKTIQTLKS